MSERSGDPEDQRSNARVGQYVPSAAGSRSPNPDYRRTLEDFREFEIVNFYKRLSRVPAKPRSRSWFAFSALLFGAGLGGLLALIPIVETKGENEPVPAFYVVALIVTGAASLTCFLAARRMRDERVETVEALQEDLGQLLNVYGIDPDDWGPGA